MKILIGADHAGFELKNQLLTFLKERGFNVEDFGAKKYDENDNFTEILTPLAFEIARLLTPERSNRGQAENPEKIKGIVIGRSGQGEAMVCNRFPGVRAIVYDGGNLEVVRLGREHNDANVLSLGAQFVPLDEAKQAVELWLTTPFSTDSKYAKRNEMLDEIS